jgi:endo-1,4-beta-xylanase
MLCANRLCILPCAALAVAASASISRAQTALTGSSLALKSSGIASLSSAGYVGTHLTVPAGGATVHFTVNASSAAGTGAAPHMNLVIADSVTGFSLASPSSTAYTTPDVTLPAGTYLVRAERDYPSNVGVTRSLTVNNLSVSTVAGSGTATFVNSSTDANALAAANTYIDNFRKGPATVTLTGPGGVPLLPGTPVHVELARHAFNFGTAVPGSNSSTVNAYFGSTGTVQQTSYQSHLNQNFNAVVPENMGKWSSNEATRGVTTMAGIDTILNYAQSHNMRARMHNVIWGSQQPNWVNTLLTNAGNGNATAKSDLRNAITSRIDYYVGTGSAATDRAGKYAELDVYNESYHTGAAASGNNNYWKIYGPSGVADIYNEVAQTVASYPNPPKLFVNDYNVLQNSNDAYANWYASHVSLLRDAGGAVGGIGIQYYPNPSIGPGDTQHTSARIASVLQNLSTQEIPLALTEFGVGTGGTQATAAKILDDSLRLVFGTPGATGFFMWGF